MLEAPPHPADLKAYAKVRTYFATCMAEGQDSQRHSSGQLILWIASAVRMMMLIHSHTIIARISQI